MIAQITYDTTDCRTAGQDEGGSFEYYRSPNAPTLKHGQTQTSTRITVVHISFPLENRIVRVVLICANPTHL